MADVWDDLLAAHGRTAPMVGTGIPEHRPRAAVLACSDARVPPSIVFDQPAGELFVVRVAGNTAGPRVLASLDFAVDHLGVELIVVLGHTHCGAVAAALDGSCTGALAAVTHPICTVVERHPGADADAVAHHNVESTLRDLTAHDGAVGRAVRSGRISLVGAVHDLESGRVLEIARPCVPVDIVPVNIQPEAS